ncbi:MAG: AAA family ATPase [Verrucomicrobiota bacterium]
MKITALQISNFRCFGLEAVTVELDKFTSFIGANGAGKSAVLHGLLKLFGARKGERSLTRADFHIPPGTDVETVTEIRLWIEAKLEFPKLMVDANDPAVPECFRHMIVEAPGAIPFCRVRLEGVWRRTAQAEGEVDEKLCWVMTAAANPPEDSKQPMSNYDRSRIQVIYVPASRDPSGQLRQAAGTLLHPLLTAIRWSDATKTSATESAKQIRDAVGSEPGMRSLEKAVGDEWKKLQEFAPLREVKFQPLSPEFEALLRHVEAVFHPGAGIGAQPIERLSDGLRSLFYFSLLGARFDLERLVTPVGETPPFDFESAELPSLTVFAIEEPENHLAPQYLARILALLQRLSNHDGAQVLLTSHSPGILSRVEPETIRHLRLNESTGRARIKALALPAANAGEVYKYVKEAVRAYPELYFASGVIFGEGDSEAIVLPRVAAATGRFLDQRFVSVVPLGGRHVNHFWRLLRDLEIPYVTLLDLDRERSGGDWGRIHYVLTQLLEFSPAVSLATLGITQQQLDVFPTGRADDSNMQSWINSLEQYGVFFCTPLDLDFSMLTAFPAAYHAATTGTGPRIPNAAPQNAERLAQARNAVLKPEGGDGHTYNAAEQAEFIWYHYLFLGRQKPSTHILALNQLTANQLKNGMPAVFTRLLDRIAPVPPPPPPVA